MVLYFFKVSLNRAKKNTTCFAIVKSGSQKEMLLFLPFSLLFFIYVYLRSFQTVQLLNQRFSIRNESFLQMALQSLLLEFTLQLSALLTKENRKK
jgi:hypothetical protein